MSECEWVVQVDDAEMIWQLGIALNAVELRRHLGSSGGRRVGTFVTPELVDQVGGLRIEVFSREHPPPHFRVFCSGETANYRISDCEQLNGGLRRYYGAIRNWHTQNKAKLIDVWNKRRPTDCPVGAYRED